MAKIVQREQTNAQIKLEKKKLDSSINAAKRELENVLGDIKKEEFKKKEAIESTSKAIEEKEIAEKEYKESKFELDDLKSKVVEYRKELRLIVDTQTALLKDTIKAKGELKDIKDEIISSKEYHKEEEKKHLKTLKEQREESTKALKNEKKILEEDIYLSTKKLERIQASKEKEKENQYRIYDEIDKAHKEQIKELDNHNFLLENIKSKIENARIILGIKEEDTKKTINKLNDSIYDKNVEYNDISNKIIEAKNILNESIDGLRIHASESELKKESIRKEIESLKKKKESIQEEYNRMQSQRFSFAKRNGELEKLYNNIRKIYNKAGVKMPEIDIKL